MELRVGKGEGLMVGEGGRARCGEMGGKEVGLEVDKMGFG
jgi:hypothetical protein